MSLVDKSQVFLFSSLKENPDKYFQGYCFSGSDYIFGDKGAELYRAQTGRDLLPGEDGCYVTVSRKGNVYHFGSDFSGNKKIFYFSGRRAWAVSNSLERLIAHLQNNGIQLSPDFSQLRAMGVGKGASPLNQLYSWATMAQGISLVPLGSVLEIGNSGARIRSAQTSQNAGNKSRELSYQGALKEFLETWLARLETVLADRRININSDLTGGLDSRVVFALLRAAMTRFSDTPANVRINCGSIRGDSADLDVATSICNKFGLPINGPRVGGVNRFSSREAYESWRQLCLGVYHPIYFPAAAPSLNLLSLGGGGGENHRPFYRDGSVDLFVRRRSSRIYPDWLKYSFEAEIRSTMDDLLHSDGSAHDPLMLHYRHFRNRCHAGRSPQYAVMFAPLSSGLLEKASDASGMEALAAGQVTYDILASIMPELLDIPFDVTTKSPTDFHRKRLSVVPLSGEKQRGAVYAGDDCLEKRAAPSQGPSQWTLLYEDFRASRASKLNQDFWGRSWLDEVESMLERAVDNRSFDHPVDGQPVSAVLATGIFE